MEATNCGSLLETWNGVVWQSLDTGAVLLRTRVRMDLNRMMQGVPMALGAKRRDDDHRTVLWVTLCPGPSLESQSHPQSVLPRQFFGVLRNGSTVDDRHSLGISS